MEIKIEPNQLASLSKRMLEHQNRAKNLQYSLERETGKASSILSRSEFPPPFSGQISATNGSIKETSQTIVQTLEYQAAWLSYFAHQASGADNVPLSLTQATAILAKYDDRFKDPGKTDGIDAGKLTKDAAGELTGVYDAQRAATGIDPATGEKISGWSRVMAGGMFALGFTPIGKGIKAFKVVRTADKVIGVAKEGQAARRVVGSADVSKISSKTNNHFIGTLKGEKIHFEGVRVEEIKYTKRLPEETAKLRKEFNSSVRKNFLKGFANDPVRVEHLRKAGLTEGDIARMKDGLNPKGWQVHHNLPLDDGGNNDLNNLVLIKNDPFHKAVTNEQNSLTRGLTPTESKKIHWPLFEDNVYPPKLKRREE
ncbi:hypothetical protein DMO16_18725 [Fictibacillus sp. S7]|nr:hypothetical protein DMO16_18725 [Fictibacillus sp. S7]